MEKYRADGVRESYKVEMSCELASHKEFRHACLRSVIAPKIVYFVGFLIMSSLADTIAANSGGRRCKEKRKVGHTSKGFQNLCSTIQTRLQQYADITELDPITFNKLVRQIVVHEEIGADGTRKIDVEIHFNMRQPRTKE